jgi:hypothetical protein
VDGRANDAVCRALADALGVRRRDVTLVVGAAGRDKIVEVASAGIGAAGVASGRGASAEVVSAEVASAGVAGRVAALIGSGVGDQEE